MTIKSSAELVHRVPAIARKRPKGFDDTVTVELPKFMKDFFADFLQELEEHYQSRPYPIRDLQQAWGIIDEEWDEVKRQVRHTNVGDSFDKAIHDICELAVVSAMAYMDLTVVEESRKKS